MQSARSQGALVTSAVLLTVIAGAAADFRGQALPRVPWQPASPGAFAIWGVIYAGVLLHGVMLFQHPQPWGAVGALVASLGCCIGWLFAVGSQQWVVSAVCIALAFGAALLSVGLHPPPAGALSWTEVALQFGPGLLCGWLAVAAALGVNLPRLAREQSSLPAWSALPLVFAGAAVGVAARAPGVGAALLWTSAFLPGWTVTRLLILASGAAVVMLSFTRRPEIASP